MENQLIQIDGTLGTCSTSAACYFYDTQGRRVQKIIGSAENSYLFDLSGHVVAEDNGTSWGPGYVYAGGQLIAEYKNSTTYFVHDNNLGSSTILTSLAGAVADCNALYPFGEQDNTICSPSNLTSHKFTGKERDTESNLDNFGARYNASSMGRFMTPDPLHIMKQKLVDPQQWNMYAYARNNPLRFIDPTGMYDVDYKNGDKKCSKAANNFEKQRQKGLKSKDLKVREAAKAWGNRGEHNHVSVTLKPQAEVDRDAGTQPGYRTDAIVRPIGARGDDDAHLQAEFSESLGGSSLGQTIAHEGSHVKDDMSFLGSYDPSTGRYNPALNFTHFDTEFQAFEAGSGVKSYSMFPRGPRGYQQLQDYIYRAYPNADELVFPSAVFPQ